MKNNFLKAAFSLPYKEFFFLCLLTNVIVGGATLLLSSSLPPVVPLLYGLPVGEEQLVSKYLLSLPSLISILLTVGNGIIAKFSSVSFVQKVLVGLTIAVTLLASVTTLKIFFLVASF